MIEPSRPHSRHMLAGGVAAAIAIAGAGFVIGRSTTDAPDRVEAAPAAPVPSPSPTPAAALPAVVPMLDRAALLNAAAVAVDAFASGRPLPPEVAALDGRRFELRLPFGCRGPAASDALLGWSYDPEDQALRVTAAPVRFDPVDWLGQDAGSVDLIEGFWVTRPWSSGEACPPTRASPGQAEADPERTLAVAEFHGTGASRAGRREGEAFKATRKAGPDALDLKQGLQLRLTGRIAAPTARHGAVICRDLARTGERPICLVAVSLDEVAMDNPATGSTLGTWSVSRVRMRN